MSDTDTLRPYLPYSPGDEAFFGAEAVVQQEYAAIWLRRRRGEAAPADQPDDHDQQRPDDMVGLALSGGGIRSASFALGLLQALAFRGWLPKVDYLSTVSGGGYIGASLTWLLHRAWPAAKPPDPEADTLVRFGVGHADFPYGLYPVAGARSDPNRPEHRFRGRLLRYLRQNARYLTPGRGLGALSLVAVILRNSLYSAAVYGGLLLLGLVLLAPLLYLPLAAWWPVPAALDALAPWPMVRVLLLSQVLLFVALVPPYAWWTGQAHAPGASRQYLLRRAAEIWAGRGLWLMLGLGVLALLPVVSAALSSLGGAAQPAPGAPVAGSLSALLGLVSSVLAFFRAQAGHRNRTLTNALVVVGTGTLVFGVLLMAYGLALAWLPLDTLWPHRLGWGAVLALGLWLLARYVNTNYMSVHRYYRDRLMETFLPNVTDAGTLEGVPDGVAQEADHKTLHTLWPPARGQVPGPYPLINTHVVLASSKIPKFRGRGGDNFVLTPGHCGSNATGWVPTGSFYNWMTLASAMAISGAAVNPNSGVGGQGITRQPLLSFLMGLLNIRLGYWVLNPMPRALRLQRLARQTHTAQPDTAPAAEPPARGALAQAGAWLAAKSGVSAWLAAAARDEVQASQWARARLWLAERLSPQVPNALWPGVAELFLRTDLDENSHMLQLTDGGHFENLGLYELVRRQLPLIIVSDAGADPDYTFGDLANALEKVRADFGVIITLDGEALDQLIPRPGHPLRTSSALGAMAARGHLVADILYPDAQAEGGTRTGRLIYLTTTYFAGLSADLHGYRRINPDFPDQSTANQFFDERQFDAYRELGYQTTLAMLDDPDVRRDALIERCLGAAAVHGPGGQPGSGADAASPAVGQATDGAGHIG